MSRKHFVNRLNVAEEAYIQTIDALIKRRGHATVSNIAQALNVKPPSVTEMLKKLSAMQLVWHSPYCPVTLAPKGRELADFLKQQQMTLQRLFELLDIDEHIAKTDACKIASNLNEVTLERLAQYVEFIENTYHSDNCLSCFRTYLKNVKPH